MNWDEICDQIHQHGMPGDLGIALANTQRAVDERELTNEQIAALKRHGYEPRAAPIGMSRDTRLMYIPAERIILRYRVCELDGIEIDGHEASDLDTDATCIHCNKEWPW